MYINFPSFHPLNLSIFNEEDSCIFRESPPLPCQRILCTPYGGRLEYTLPKGNLLMVHFKDKLLIRHKKRWSQVRQCCQYTVYHVSVKGLTLFQF